MSAYPIKSIIRTKLDERNSTVKEFLINIDMSSRWWHGDIAIEKMQLGLIMQISAQLGFDVLIDYYAHIGKEDAPKAAVMHEPEVKYSSSTKEDALTITLVGSPGILKGKVERLIEAINKSK